MNARAHRIVLAGGGTGGHLYPALSLADELRTRRPTPSISFIGARRGLERKLVPQAGYPLRTLRLSGIKGRGGAGKLAAGTAAGWAVARCMAWMLAPRPHLVIGVGGYASGPAVLAACMLKIDTMVMEQNHYPGATNRWLAPRVDAVCVPSETARQRLGGIGIVTGTPVRREFTQIGDLPGGDRLSLLVFGGSAGAQSVNREMVTALERLSALPRPPRIVHQTGTADYEATVRSYGSYPEGLYEVLPFIENMPARLAAADLVVCRAGASTLAELAAAGRPAILVPYPYAANDHQRHNAETVERAGGALVVQDDELDGNGLADTIQELASDAARLAAMARAARSLAVPDATRRIAGVADALLSGRSVDVS